MIMATVWQCSVQCERTNEEELVGNVDVINETNTMDAQSICH